MTAKEYLSQAYRLDQRISSKIQQVDSLNGLARKVSSTITGMPKGSDYASCTMADVITKIIDLQAEINSDIDRLVDLNREMVTVIKAVGNVELQTLLEFRYLCFKSWEQIAVEMDCTVRNVHLLHSAALQSVKIPFRFH